MTRMNEARAYEWAGAITAGCTAEPHKTQQCADLIVSALMEATAALERERDSWKEKFEIANNAYDEKVCEIENLRQDISERAKADLKELAGIRADQITYHEKAMEIQKERDELTNKNCELQEKLDEYENAYKFIMDDKCFNEEKHCACAPILRVKMKELEAENALLKARLEPIETAHRAYKNYLSSAIVKRDAYDGAEGPD